MRPASKRRSPLAALRQQTCKRPRKEELDKAAAQGKTPAAPADQEAVEASKPKASPSRKGPAKGAVEFARGRAGRKTKGGKTRSSPQKVPAV